MKFWLWLAFTAHSHPFGARFAAHLVELEVSDSAVRVNYLADVPNPIVQTSTRDPSADPLAEMALELLSGLLLEVDGATLRMEPVGPWSARATEDTHQFQWTLEAALPNPPTDVVVSNANLPDVAAVYRSRVSVGGSSVPTACSLWRMRDNAIALDETDRWRTDERNRTLSVSLAEPAGALSPLWNIVSPPPEVPALAADRWLPPLEVAVRTRTLTPALAGLATSTTAVGALLLFLLYRRFRRVSG